MPNSSVHNFFNTQSLHDRSVALEAATDKTARSTWHELNRRLNGPLLFAIAYIGCQVLLLVLGSTPLRVPLRIGAYSISLLMLVRQRPGRTGRHPALSVLPLVLGSLAIGMLVSGQSSVLAAVAQVTLYVAILAPLSWVSHRPLSLLNFRRVVLLLWAYNAMSAGAGVLQIYYPGMFQGQISSVITEKGADYLGSLTIELADGSRALRPMGLTDAPGGAANSGSIAILFGIGLLLTERRWPLQALALVGMVVALFIIYLTQVRVALVVVAVGTLVITGTLAIRKEFARATTLLSVLVGVALLGTSWAFTVGGNQTVQRFNSLIESHPYDVYGQNRGAFVSDAFGTQLLEHPFGQGAGRWGMINYYFGDRGDALWAEIMWQAWLYDGGIFLMLTYCWLLAVAVTTAWKAATSHLGGALTIWAAVILAYNLAALAATFDAPVFGTQGGLELWFMNACFFNVWAHHRSGGRHASTRPPALPTRPRVVAA